MAVRTCGAPIGGTVGATVVWETGVAVTAPPIGTALTGNRLAAARHPPYHRRLAKQGTRGRVRRIFRQVLLFGRVWEGVPLG
jgi:hypothetical protein